MKKAEKYWGKEIKKIVLSLRKKQKEHIKNTAEKWDLNTTE